MDWFSVFLLILIVVALCGLLAYSCQRHSAAESRLHLPGASRSAP
jgi:hypothetical protein